MASLSATGRTGLQASWDAQAQREGPYGASAAASCEPGGTGPQSVPKGECQQGDGRKILRISNPKADGPAHRQDGSGQGGSRGCRAHPPPFALSCTPLSVSAVRDAGRLPFHSPRLHEEITAPHPNPVLSPKCPKSKGLFLKAAVMQDAFQAKDKRDTGRRPCPAAAVNTRAEPTDHQLPQGQAAPLGGICGGTCPTWPQSLGKWSPESERHALLPAG